MENALKVGNSHIYSALLKNGHSNFSVTILEYCEPSKLLIREKYYIDLGAEYNIIKDPTLPPMSGRKHSDKSKKIMSDAKKGTNHSDETNKIMSEIENSGDYKTGNNHPNYGKKVEGSGSPAQAIEVIDITNDTTTSYDSINEVARALNINQSSISKFLKNNQQKPYKGIYTFRKI
jgi:group I intron endonuclease